jgi:antitoxin component YwqK of YwqJK toxin-antitoxin module
MAMDFLEHPAQYLNKLLCFLMIILMGCRSQHSQIDKTVEFYPSSTDTASVIFHLNGLEHGEWRKYYPSGQLMEKRYFNKGVKVGVMKNWWENGQLQSEYHFNNGEYDGTCREWNVGGLLIREMNYENGYEQGSQKQWYDNGSYRSNYVIRDGRRYGLLGTKNCVNVSDSLDIFR